jgi:hypothetical protein
MQLANKQLEREQKEEARRREETPSAQRARRQTANALKAQQQQGGDAGEPWEEGAANNSEEGDEDLDLLPDDVLAAIGDDTWCARQADPTCCVCVCV